MQINDSQLISDIMRGDKTGYESLIEKYKKMVYGIAWSRLGDSDLSEDAAQETFIKAYTYLATLREPDKFQGWLARIARNVCTSLSRRARRDNAFKQRWALLESAEPQSGHDECESPKEHLWQSFAELPDVHREALTLYYIEGKSTAETAAALGITEQALRTRLHRARTALRIQLEKNLEDALGDLQPRKNFTHSVLVLLPLSPTGAISSGGALAVFGKLLAGLSFALWIAAVQIFALLTMFSKLDEASLEDKPENRSIKAFIRRGYMKLAVMMFVTFVVYWLLAQHFGSSILLQISCICCVYMIWKVFKLLRVNTSTAAIGYALAIAIFFIATVAGAFFQAVWLYFIAMLLMTVIMYFAKQKMPQRVGFNLFTGSALGIFGDFEDDQSLECRLTRMELLSFAKFLGGLWLVQDYKWRADGITLFAGGSKAAITWDGACTAMMSAKDLKVARQLLGRSVEAAELQDDACRAVRFALNCFLRGDLEAAREVLSHEIPSAQNLTAARHNRVKSLVCVWLMVVTIVMLLVITLVSRLVETSEKVKELYHVAGAYYFLLVPAVGFIVAILAVAITLRRTRRQNRLL
ncbi:MAG: RNA polymerase sigma factor [Armatimonadota bacterium]